MCRQASRQARSRLEVGDSCSVVTSTRDSTDGKRGHLSLSLTSRAEEVEEVEEVITAAASRAGGEANGDCRCSARMISKPLGLLWRA
jgi:hypothetical protein